MSTTQITFRSVPHSPTVEYHINKHLKKIFAIYNKVNHCRVVVDAEHKHKNKGKPFSISIYATIPGHELFCKKQHQNLYVAIWEGFNSLDKLLKKHCKRKLTSINNFLYYLNKNGTSNIPNLPHGIV